MAYRTWTDEELIQAVTSSKTKTEVLKKIGLSSRNSGNYQTIDKYIELLKLDTSHFTNDQRSRFKEYTLEEVLVENSHYSTKNLKAKLLKHKLLVYECQKCKIHRWNDKPLALHLDHINGVKSDNRIENLRLLCPNCHSQTPTYCRGKTNKRKQNKCSACKEQISNRATMCRKCSSNAKRGKTSKIDWPNVKALQQMVKELGYLGAGRKLGVSDNAIRKRIRTRDIGV